jgi:two-component system, OmpR family, phosphate regulon response regulator PhoB
MITTDRVGNGNHGSILLVDDDPALRKEITVHLGALGFEVHALADGDAALQTLREQPADLVCVDLNLPRTSGYEVCEQIRADPALRDVIVIMTSEHATLEARAYSYEAGADAYFAKPYTAENLAIEVERLLNSAVGGYADLSLKPA